MKQQATVLGTILRLIQRSTREIYIQPVRQSCAQPLQKQAGYKTNSLTVARGPKFAVSFIKVFMCTCLQAISTSSLNLQEKRGVSQQQAIDPATFSTTTSCKEACFDVFISNIRILKHYSNLHVVSPFVISRRRWDTYNNLDSCRRSCLSKRHDICIAEP